MTRLHPIAVAVLAILSAAAADAPAPDGAKPISYASVKVLQYDDPGDVRGVLTEPIGDSFDKAGRPLR